MLFADKFITIIMSADKSVTRRQWILTVFWIWFFYLTLEKLIIYHPCSANFRDTEETFKFNLEKVYYFIHFSFLVSRFSLDMFLQPYSFWFAIKVSSHWSLDFLRLEPTEVLFVKQKKAEPPNIEEIFWRPGCLSETRRLSVPPSQAVWYCRYLALIWCNLPGNDSLRG